MNDDTTNVLPGIPHVRIVMWFCVAAMLAYAGFSIWIVGWSNDAALRGDCIGTWKSFAVAAFAFWVGSSSGGKAKDSNAPTPVLVTNPPKNPVNTTDNPPAEGAPATPDKPMEP